MLTLLAAYTGLCAGLSIYNFWNTRFDLGYLWLAFTIVAAPFLIIGAST